MPPNKVTVVKTEWKLRAYVTVTQMLQTLGGSAFWLTANRPNVVEIGKKLREIGNFTADQLNFDRYLAGSKE